MAKATQTQKNAAVNQAFNIAQNAISQNSNKVAGVKVKVKFDNSSAQKRATPSKARGLKNFINSQRAAQ